MGKLTAFYIQYTQPHAVYYAGQRVEGQVIMNLSEPLKMRGITLDFEGKANVHWTERHSRGSGKNRRTVTRHYNASEHYFNSRVILYGNQGGLFADSTMHPAGSFVFPFQFQLPYSLPSSFEGVYGYVRYGIKCCIDRPWKFDHKTKSPFTVIGMLDLNQVPDAMIVPQRQGSKTLCCLCCASAPIEVVVRLDRKGYVPGENITVNAEVNNGSSRRVDSTSVKLVQTVVFHATTKSRSITNTVAMKKGGAIGGGESEIWSGEKLHIPPVPASHLVGCNIIDIRYQVVFSMDPSGPATDLDLPMEVIIGTVPLRNFFGYMSAEAAASAVQPYPPVVGPADYYEPTAPPMAQPNLPSAPLMPGAPPDAPPPSYVQSVFGKVDIRDDGDEHTRGDLNYAPVYPYYNWDNEAYSLPVQSAPDS